MRRTLCKAAFCLIVLLASTFAAFSATPSMLTIDGGTSWQRARIERLESQLNFTHEPMPNTWNIHIIPGTQFNENVKRLNVDTSTAYTFIQIDQTYLNEDYLTTAPEFRIRHNLAHEAGHMICQCRDENRAEAIAAQLEQ
jgi:hypothetical protein